MLRNSKFNSRYGMLKQDEYLPLPASANRGLSSSVHDTIVAVSSPPGNSIRSIVRLSGAASFEILHALTERGREPPGQRVCSPEFGVRSSKFEIRSAEHGKRVEKRVVATAWGLQSANVEEHRSWRRLDVRLPLIVTPDRSHHRKALPGVDAIVYVMPAPYSYTREDVVELHLPGVAPVVQHFVERCVALGARTAAPGEITRRAFLAGRIDLLQAESVAALIEAEDEQSARKALANISGFLSATLRQLVAKLVQARASLEAGLDFSDQDIDPPSPRETVQAVKSVEQTLAYLLGSSTERSIAPEGTRVVLIGEENTGKSTLFNALSRVRKSIVSPLPGTTRDVIEGEFSSGKRLFKVFDTAGILPAHIFSIVQGVAGERRRFSHAATPCEGVESTGSTPRDLAMASALTAARTADIVVLVVDASMHPAPTGMQSLTTADKERLIVALNKSDLLAGREEATELKRRWSRFLPTIVLTSGLQRTGISELKSAIRRVLARQEPSAGSAGAVVYARHKEFLEAARSSCEAACRILETGEGEELACLHLQEACDRLAELLGERPCDSVLDNIFSRFCIGK